MARTWAEKVFWNLTEMNLLRMLEGMQATKDELFDKEFAERIRVELDRRRKGEGEKGEDK